MDSAHDDELEEFQKKLRGRTEFQKHVHTAVQAIPPGTTQSYGQVAAAIGKPNAYRAVASVMSNNGPFCARAGERGDCPPEHVVPCHRVTDSHGKHKAYLGDTSHASMEYIKKLLEDERNQTDDGRSAMEM